MLDDTAWIRQKDPSDSLGVAAAQHKQLQHVYNLTSTNLGPARNIVLAGMGGSALYACFLRTWPGETRPFEIVRDYELPPYVDGDTLFIASSYSGNTEETLSAFAAAERRGAHIAVIAAGGKLHQLAEEKGYLLATPPQIPQPRYASFAMLRALLDILAMAGMIRDGHAQEIEQAAVWLAEAVKVWTPDVPTANNPAKQLAQELLGKSLVVYAGPKLAPAANKWKITCNENAKQVAWWNQLPEFNHNEFIGWSGQPQDKPYAVVDLRSNLEHPRVQKRFEVTERLLSGMRPAPHVVQAQGDTVLQQVLWTAVMGDFVTLYLALLNGVDPAPVDLVERFKKSLDE